MVRRVFSGVVIGMNEIGGGVRFRRRRVNEVCWGSGVTPDDGAVDRQDDNGAYYGQEEAPEIELCLYGAASRKETVEESPEERPCDAEQHGYYAAARVAPRHNHLGDDAGYEAEDYPRQYAHLSSFVLVKFRNTTYTAI